MNAHAGDLDATADESSDAGDESEFATFALTLTRDRYIPRDAFLDMQEPWLVTLNRDDDDGNLQVVGEMVVYEFRQARETDFFDNADSIDSEMANLAGALTDGSFGLPDHLFRWPLSSATDVLVISRIGIDPAYRGRGLGGQLVTCALDAILGDRVALIATYPAPFEALDDGTAWARVRKWWEAQGFVHVAGGVAIAPHIGYLAREYRPKELRRFGKEWREMVATPWVDPDAPLVISERMVRLLI